MINKSENYKGCRISASVYQSPDIPNGKFLVEGWIAFDMGQYVDDGKFWTTGLYDSEEAAYEAFIAAAKKYIDSI